MTDMFGNDDTNPFEGNPNNGLRSWAENVQKQNQELQKALADVQGQLKQTTVSSVLDELGVPKAAASLYRGDADPEAIKSWVTDIKSAFGIQGEQNQQGTGEPVVPAAPVLTQEQQLQYQQLSQAGSEGRQSTGIEDVQRGINQATNVQELIAQFQNLR
jgi:hypothetical protein